MPNPPQIFNAFLHRKRALQSPYKADAVSLLQLFNLSGLDYQGQISSGYGHTGLSVTTAVGFDLTSLLLPLIPLPMISSEIEVSLSGNVLREYLILLQRYPNAFYKRVLVSDVSPTATPGGTWRYRNEQRIAKPVCLLGLEGTSGNVTVGTAAGVKAGVTLAFPSTEDELGIDISAQIGASGEISGKVVRLRGVYTASFPSPSDDALEQYDLLEQVVSYLFTMTDKKDLTRQVESMINGWLADEPAALPSAASSKEIVGKLQRVLSHGGFELRPRVASFLAGMWKKARSSRSSESLRQQLDALRSAVVAEHSLNQAQRATAIKQIDMYSSLLDIYNQRSAAKKATGEYWKQQSFFHLFSFAAAVGTDASAKAGVSVTIPLAALQLTQLQGSVGVGALASAKVNIQRIAYRYQSCLDTRALAFTQDTWITYRQAVASAQAFAEAGFLSSERHAGVERERVYQSMTYVSTVLYWRMGNPFVTPDSVTPEAGSGLRIGMSASTSKLIAYARSRGATPGGPATQAAQSDERYINTICRSLRISVDQFLQFIDGSELRSLDETQPDLPSHVLLESAFPYALSPASSPVRLIKKPDLIQPTSFREHCNREQQSFWGPLESVRLRIRTADVVDTRRTLFTLGFPTVIASITIDLSQVKGAGQEGAFDYYVRWFHEPDMNSDPQRSKDAQEMSVPPVVLLHQ